MLAKVTLKVVRGKLLGQEFSFAERTTCLLGRAEDCNPKLPNDADHATISRHHCLLDINPPDARIRDFGSLNGTYVGGVKIGQRERNQTPEAAVLTPFPEYDLNDGDEIELGDTVFRVAIHVMPECPMCGAEISPSQHAAAQARGTPAVCTACRAPAPPQSPRPQEVNPAIASQPVCAQCGKNVAEEVGSLRQGAFVCASCKAEPWNIAAGLLQEAQAGEEGLQALQGFEIVKELGRGGMGAVFLARHRETGRQVALKLMLPRVASDPRAQRMFLREVEATRVLDHPHIVRLLHFGAAHGTFFFTLEYCDGGSVAELQRRSGGGRLPVEQAVEIVLQALAGAHYAHHLFGTSGLVHRDLKPANLFVSGSGPNRVIKIGDYGLGKAFDMAGLSGQTRTGTAAGTPVFMPRQQVINFKYARPEVDVWALAATLYSLLTGQAPRDFPPGRDPWQVVLQSAPVPIRQRDPSIPHDLANVIDTVLRDSPELAVKSAAAFQEALQNAVPNVRVQPVDAAAAATPSSDASSSPSQLNAIHAYSPAIVVQRYPAPIALPYQRCFRQTDTRLRLDLLIAAVEATLRYLVTLGLADLLGCIAQRCDDAARLPEHQAFDFLRRSKAMQLGMWCEALRETARSLSQEQHPTIPELPTVCQPGGRLDVALGKIIARRNECVHRDGAIAISPEECHTAIRDVRPLLEDVLQQIRFITRYPLAFVRRGLPAAGAEPPSYLLCSAMGVEVGATMPEALVTGHNLQDGMPFVVTPDGARLLYLWPLLTQRRSPLSGRPTLYVFEDIPNRKRPNLTETRSAAIDLSETWVQTHADQPAEDHRWLFERLRALPSPMTLPPEFRLPQRLAPDLDARLVGQVFGDNRLVARIGGGGVGTVYRAETPAGETVAVKVLEATCWSDQAFRFQNEFERLRQFHEHPGIIRCYESGVAVLQGREYPWYSMELAAQGNLRTNIERRKNVAADQLAWNLVELRPQIIDEFRAIVTAVKQLHQKNIIHRDLKPDNVLIVASGELRLSDFGLLKHLQPSQASLIAGPQTATGAVTGTWGYMAPEQMRGQDATEAADVYALGILLAELATGERPEPDLDQPQQSTLHKWRLLADVPPPLRRLIVQCTDVDPNQRPSNAAAMQERFEQIVGQS